jgi:hypothetical protein
MLMAAGTLPGTMPRVQILRAHVAAQASTCLLLYTSFDFSARPRMTADLRASNNHIVMPCIDLLRNLDVTVPDIAAHDSI